MVGIWKKRQKPREMGELPAIPSECNKSAALPDALTRLMAAFWVCIPDERE